MSFYSIPPAIGALLSLGLGFFVLMRNARSETNLAFCGTCFSLVFWLGPYALAYSTQNTILATTCARIACTAVSFFSLFMYHFVVAFLSLTKEKKYLFLAYLATFTFFLGFAFTNYLLNGTHKYFCGYYSKAGVFHPFYIGVTFAMWFRCFYLLYEELKQPNSPTRRNQIRYALAAYLIVMFSTVDYIQKYGIEFYPFGFVFALAYLLTTSYAIVRHQLLDIEVVVKRTLVFAGLAGSVVAVVSLMAFVSQDVLAHLVTIPKWLSNVLSAAIIAAVYGPTRNWLVNVTDRVLFQKRYDYKVLLKKFTDEVMGVIELKRVVQMTVHTLTETAKLEHCSLLLLSQDKRTYELVAAQGAHGPPIELEEAEPCVTFLRETHEPIGLDGELGQVRFPAAVTDRMQQLHARLCLPLHIHEDLIGLLCLGKKKSDEAFTKDDLDILLPLAKTLAIAVSNAQLFDELMETHEQLKTATTRLLAQERLVAAGQFAAGMAHEIKNPLSAIKTFAEFLPEKYDDPAFQQKFFRIVQAEIERITGLVKELSDFAKPAPLELQPVPLSALLTDTLALLANQCLQRGLEVRTRFGEGDRRISADPQQLKQVCLNLLLNSLEAMESGGTLEVATRVHGPHVLLSITDTGPGMAPDVLSKIWDPFFTTKARGMGLGLAIVKGIVERHGGRITMTSVPRQGTTVEVRLPLFSS